MSTQSTPLPVHDGSTGNLIQRAEPKVKAASIAALLTPLALYYLYRYVPGVASLPHELDVILATLVTGSTTFAAGFAARAVDRIDIFTRPYLQKAEEAADRTVGTPVVDELETWAKGLAAPVKTAVVDAVHAVEQAAGAGQDPVAAAKHEAPAVLDAVSTAVADGRAEADAALAPVVAQAAVDVPAVAADVAAAPSVSQAAEELMAELRKMLALLDAGTPIGDQAQAAAAPADAPAADLASTQEFPAVGSSPPVPAPAAAAAPTA